MVKIAEKNLPKLPPDFQTRVQATINSTIKIAEMLIIYTNTFRRAETILYDGHYRSQHIYNYQTNEVYVIEKGECHVEKLNETTALNMFGLVMKPDGVEEMKPAEYVLFFNNGVPHV